MTSPSTSRDVTERATASGRRQCTDNYKIRPVRRKVRELLGLRPRQRVPSGTTVDLWLGISTDEAIRVKTSRDRWIANRYPLIEAGMSRRDCADWWAARYDRPLERSACVACPFQSRQRWVETKRRWPELFAEAVQIDANLRGRAGLRQRSRTCTLPGCPSPRRSPSTRRNPAKAALPTASATSARGAAASDGRT